MFLAPHGAFIDLFSEPVVAKAIDVAHVAPPVSILLAYWFGGAFLMAAKRVSEHRAIVEAGGTENLAAYRPSFAVYTQSTLVTSCLVYAQGFAFMMAIFLLKYRIGARRYRPFVDAGVTFSHTSTDVTFSQDCLSSASVCAAYFSSVLPAGASVQPYYNLLGHQNSTINTFGPTAGVGVEFKIGKFKLAPEVRYTHLSNPTRKLATVMLGFTF